MKKLICMMLLLGCVLTLTAQTYNIEMKAPGMMWYYVEYGDAMYATSIKVKGSINGDDIRLLRQLAGGKYGKELDEPDFGCLENLDLSEARIVDGGGAYWFGGLYAVSHLSRISPERAMTYTSADVVGQKMFEDCLRLKRLVLPRVCKNIHAYFDNTPLGYVRLPESIEEIDLNIFISLLRNKQLQIVASPAKEPPLVTKSENMDFRPFDCDLLVPIGSKEKYAAVAGWKDFRSIEEYDFDAETAVFDVGDMTFRVTDDETAELIDFRVLPSEIIIPEKVEYHDRFLRVVGIDLLSKGSLKAEVKSVALPSSIEYIGDYSFYMAPDLTTINFPEGLREIGANAFELCGKLKEACLPDGIKVIGSHAFYDCWSLNTLRLPADLEVIGRCAFSAFGAKTIELPATLREIGGCAFNNNDLRTIVCHVTEPIPLLGERGRLSEEEGNEFNVYSLEFMDLYVPDESVELYKEAPVWKKMKIHPMSEYVPSEIEEAPVADTFANASAASGIFSVGGQQLPAVQQGLNIVKESGEPARKVIRK